MDLPSGRIAAVIPCYRVKNSIAEVIAHIGPEVHIIFCVDDGCPEQSGDFIQHTINDSRVKVLRHEKRQGVGGAMITGYEQALRDGAEMVVKLDGDGQMNAAYIPILIRALQEGKADYAKGNRFYRIEDVQQMPFIRLMGNAVLSLFSKVSSGYWDIFDTTNGFTAIQGKVLALLPLKKISHSYFFESDMLFRLNTTRAVVLDIPMPAIYGKEVSNLHVLKIIPEFILKHFANFIKRIFYTHLLRSFDLAALYLLAGIPLIIFGASYGIYRWLEGMQTGVPATAGTVMLAGLPFLLGIQCVISFFHYDMLDIPRQPLHSRMPPSLSSSRQETH